MGTARGILFDYGNTLIPFGRREMGGIATGLAGFFVERIPGATPESASAALAEVWADQYRHRITTRTESDPRNTIRWSFERLGRPASEEEVEECVELQCRTFLEVARAGEGLTDVLDELRGRGYRIGVVSNYSLGDVIRDSLERIGVASRLDSVVVSADLGLVKPHPEVFLAGAAGIGVACGDILFVGDSLRLDIAGAAAVGMRTAHITEHLKNAHHFTDPGEANAEIRPDLVLARLTDILEEV